MKEHYYICSVREGGIVLNEDGWWYDSKEEVEEALERYELEGKLPFIKTELLNKPPFEKKKTVWVKPKHDKLIVWKQVGRIRINRPNNLQPIVETNL